MKFYCEECDEMYEEKDLNKIHYINLNEDCYECPECGSMELTVVAQNTKLGICWNEELESITSIEYDSESCEIIKEDKVLMKSIAKVVQHYMNYFELESVEIEGLNIQKVVDKN